MCVCAGVYPWTNIPRFSCGIPAGKQRSGKEKGSVKSGPQEIRPIAISSLKLLFFFMRELRGVNSSQILCFVPLFTADYRQAKN